MAVTLRAARHTQCLHVGPCQQHTGSRARASGLLVLGIANPTRQAQQTQLSGGRHSAGWLSRCHRGTLRATPTSGSIGGGGGGVASGWPQMESGVTL